MQGAFLILFTLFYSVTVLAFDGLMVNNLFKQFESSGYPSVTGTVTRSLVQIHHSSKGGVSYEPVINYHYSVSGQSFTGKKLRYNPISSSSQFAASSVVGEHPAGSTVLVFYNPENPRDTLLFTGIKGCDFLLILFLTPFNAVMIGLFAWSWSWLRERIVRPAAGGMKIITDGMNIRVRLPQYGAMIWCLATTGGLGFTAMFIIGFGMQMNPSIPVALSTLTVVFLGGLGALYWQWMKIQSGIDDLVINEDSRSLELPLTFGRNVRMTVNLADIESLTVERIEHRNSKGGVTFSYAPTLHVRGDESAASKLADWSDKLRADDFAAWLRQKLGI